MRRVLLVALTIVLVLPASALTAASLGLGPAFFCDAGTLYLSSIKIPPFGGCLFMISVVFLPSAT
jgi:hypothetical protein